MWAMTRGHSGGRTPSRVRGRSDRYSGWFTGRTRISFTSTCGGLGQRVHHRAGDVLGLKRALLGSSKNGVSTMPGSISVTFIGVSATSARRLSPIAGHGPLGGRVERARERPAAGHRAGEQHVPGVLLAEVGERGADRQRAAVHVGVDHRAPVLDGLLEEAARGAEAGVGEEGVEAAEALDGVASRSAAGRPSSVTSQRRAIACSSPPSSAASSDSLSSERAASATRQPSLTAWRAVSAPMPLLAPVMSSTGSSAMEGFYQ